MELVNGPHGTKSIVLEETSVSAQRTDLSIAQSTKVSKWQSDSELDTGKLVMEYRLKPARPHFRYRQTLGTAVLNRESSTTCNLWLALLTCHCSPERLPIHRWFHQIKELVDISSGHAGLFLQGWNFVWISAHRLICGI